MQSFARAIAERWFRLSHRRLWVSAAAARGEADKSILLAIDREQTVVGADHRARHGLEPQGHQFRPRGTGGPRGSFGVALLSIILPSVGLTPHLRHAARACAGAGPASANPSDVGRGGSHHRIRGSKSLWSAIVRIHGSATPIHSNAASPMEHFPRLTLYWTGCEGLRVSVRDGKRDPRQRR
jgi:hypothetical protein